MATTNSGERLNSASPLAVFLNLPYDSKFQPLFLAYIRPFRDLSVIASNLADRIVEAGDE